MADGPSSNSPPWLTFIDHTADVGIVVSAPDLPTLFARAAWGMFAVITDVPGVRAQTALRVAVEAEDRAALLVRWLSELNFLHVTQHWLLSRFEIGDFCDTRLVAVVAGESIDRSRHVVHTEIKAVTFHGLSIESAGGGWRAQIIFDL
jgi:SHS2 domain-containing protein